MKISNFFIHAEDANISGLAVPGGSNFTPSANSTISDLFNKGGVDIINLVFVFIGIMFFVNFVMAGWDFMLSSGDPKKAAVANQRMTNGLSGLLMAITAFLVVKILSTILGLGATI